MCVIVTMCKCGSLEVANQVCETVSGEPDISRHTWGADFPQRGKNMDWQWSKNQGYYNGPYKVRLLLVEV